MFFLVYSDELQFIELNGVVLRQKIKLLNLSEFRVRPTSVTLYRSALIFDGRASAACSDKGDTSVYANYTASYSFISTCRYVQGWRVML